MIRSEIALAVVFAGGFVFADSAFAEELGQSPNIPRIADTGIPTRQTTTPAVAPSPTKDDWQLEFHGYLRAPMRVGIATLDNPMPGQRSVQYHTAPFIPDGNYTAWTFTNNLPSPWVETFLSAGSSRVRGTIMMGSYSITDAGWRDTKAQLGINQAFITVKLADFWPGRASLDINLGSFSNRYGAAGRYDAGKYDTYLFGRTHVMGETATLNYRVSDRWLLQLEHGVGAKTQTPMEPDPNHEIPVGSTLLHHVHAGASLDKRVLFAAHHLVAFASDAARLGAASDARLTVYGAELRLRGGAYGEGYLGYSHLDAGNVGGLADAIEVLHSFSGYQLMRNYLGLNSEGYGSVNTMLLQHTMSVGAIKRHPETFWGDGPDLLFTVFGMFNSVASRDPMTDGTTRLKLGGEATYLPLSWFGAGMRVDLVQPNLDDNTQSFTVISPKLFFHTDFLSHEQIILQYTNYSYGKSVVPSWPNQNEATLDAHVVQLSATLWW